MFMFHRRICQLNGIYLVFSFLLAAGFLIQLKILYNSHQKNLRLSDYKARINVLSDEMQTVIRIANVTSELLKRLQMSLRTKRLTPKSITS